jgi:hypothetical protein
MKTSTLSLTPLLTRRAALCGTAATGLFLLFGCSPSADGRDTAGDKAAGSPTGAANTALAMTVFKDPSCGCCDSWAEIARKAGYKVEVREEPDMRALKQRLGVPQHLTSCHTAQVSGMVIEGHVPLKDVTRLVRERPSGIKGIAVPGMPAGSPGMEMPNGRTEPYQVIAFRQNGSTRVF